MNRVTRLGEFSPIGWLFSLGSLSKITELAQILGQLFSNVPVMYLFWQQMGLGDFSTNFSGHPVYEAKKTAFNRFFCWKVILRKKDLLAHTFESVLILVQKESFRARKTYLHTMYIKDIAIGLIKIWR
jgi:hypothetical protein